MTAQIISFLISHFQISGEWCYSSQMGSPIHHDSGNVGHSHAGYQRCSSDRECIYKVSRCVGSCTL